MGKQETKKASESLTSVERCLSFGCKNPVVKMGFCEEHYEQFKFGLIRKDGKPATDYEKKLGHYLAFKERQKSSKVA